MGHKFYMVNMIWTHSLFWDFEFWHLRFVYVDIHPEPFGGTLNLLSLGILFHLLLPEQFVQRHKNRSWNLYRLQVQIQPKVFWLKRFCLWGFSNCWLTLKSVPRGKMWLSSTSGSRILHSLDVSLNALKFSLRINMRVRFIIAGSLTTRCLYRLQNMSHTVWQVPANHFICKFGLGILIWNELNILVVKFCWCNVERGLVTDSVNATFPVQNIYWNKNNFLPWKINDFVHSWSLGLKLDRIV